MGRFRRPGPLGPRSRTGSIAPQGFRSALFTAGNIETAEAAEAAAEAAATAFRDWATRDNNQRCILVEMDFMAETAEAPELQTLYFSDQLFFDKVTRRPYVDCVSRAPSYSRSLSGEPLGSYSSSIGTLELLNDDGELDFMRDIACDGHSIRFYLGDVTWPVADFVLIFSAIINKVSAPSINMIQVALKDTGLLLNKSIGGTSTVGGNGANSERPRPFNFGYLHNVPLLSYDETVGGGQYVDSDDGNGRTIEEVRDKGVSVGYTDDGNGMLTLDDPPAGVVTADLRVEPLGSGRVLVSDAFEHVVGTRAGLTAEGKYDGPGPTYTTGDDNDYPLGVSVPESRNVIDLLDEFNTSGNCFWAIKRTGEFTIGRLRLNDIAEFGLTPRAIVEDDFKNGSFSLDHTSTGYYKFRAFMSRNWLRQNEFATSLTPDQQATYSRNGLYVEQPDGLGTSYANRPELYHKTLAISPIIDTLISQEYAVDDVDTLAQWMTTRRATQLPWIEIVSMTVGIDFYELELGDPVLVTHARFGEDDGVLFQVIGITINLTTAEIDLRIARRNIIQDIPDSWHRETVVIDDARPQYGKKPRVVVGVDTTIDSLLGGGGGVGGTGTIYVGFSMGSGATEEGTITRVEIDFGNFPEGTPINIGQLNYDANSENFSGIAATNDRFKVTDGTSIIHAFDGFTATNGDGSGSTEDVWVYDAGWYSSHWPFSPAPFASLAANSTSEPLILAFDPPISSINFMLGWDQPEFGAITSEVRVYAGATLLATFDHSSFAERPAPIYEFDTPVAYP